MYNQKDTSSYLLPFINCVILALATLLAVGFSVVRFGFTSYAADSSVEYIYNISSDELRHNSSNKYYRLHYAYEFTSNVRVGGRINFGVSYPVVYLYKLYDNSLHLVEPSVMCTEYEMIENTGVPGGWLDWTIGKSYKLSSFPFSYTLKAWGNSCDEDNVFTSTNIPLFSNDADLSNYLRTGDYSNAVNYLDGDISNEKMFDNQYSLIGFKCDNSVNASWTGATNPRTVANTDVEVKEYVAIYADYAQYTKKLDSVPLSDFKFSVDLSDIQNDKTSLQHLRFVPMYSQTDGVFGAWYYGNTITVDFDEYGTITNIDNPLVGYGDLKDDKPLPDGFVDLDFNDTSNNFLTDFKLENFHADFYVNAEWTSVHIPNKLQKWMDKGTINMNDIGLMVMFTYKNRQYPETDSYKKYYPRLLKVMDLKATINVADYQPTDNKYYLSDVSFVPVVSFTYYNSGMGTSMKPIEALYYGSMSHVHFNYDGSPNGAEFNNGDINGDSDGGWNIGKDNYGEGIITGDISDLDVSLKNVFVMLQGMISSLGSFPVWIASIFGFLPPWALVILGLAVVICVICRVAGR